MAKNRNIHFKQLMLGAFMFFCSLLTAQDAEYLKNNDCLINITLEDSIFSRASGVQISNNSDAVVAFILSFDKNGFYDEISLTEKILTGVEVPSDTVSKQMLILDNIANIIKSDNFRNYNFLFVYKEEENVRKLYSPMLMLSSFYDMQCHHFQRLAAQMAILTPYFYPKDFLSYFINGHNVLGVKIGDKYIFHDFDPGMPGFRFKLSDNNNDWATVEELTENLELINPEQFYTVNGKGLCPWVSDNHYISLFEKILSKSYYHNLGKVYGFFPQWVLPPQTHLKFSFPVKNNFLKHGLRMNMDESIVDANIIFKAYTQKSHDSINMLNLFKPFLEKKLGNADNINNYYLLKKGLLILENTFKSFAILPKHNVEVIVSTGKDTVFFLNNYFIPLPLKEVRVSKGHIFLQEEIQQEENVTLIDFNITDSLVINLYNAFPPIFTSDSLIKLDVNNNFPFIVGPINGYIAPFTEAKLYYYYNPFYYRFFDLGFWVKYLTPCKNLISIDSVR